MSKLNLNLYVAQTLAEYEAAKETMLDLNEAYDLGNVSEDECLEALEDFEHKKTKYETSLICCKELNKPSRKHDRALATSVRKWFDATEDEWLKASLYDDSINILQPIINRWKEYKKNGNIN